MKTTRRQFAGAAAGAFVAFSAAAEKEASGEKPKDDTAALQERIDQNHLLELEPGTYRLTKPLVLNTTRTGYAGIRGPQGTARLVMAGPGPAVRVVGDHLGTADPGSVEPHTWNEERFPVLSGFEIVGEHPEADGIELLRTMQPVIERVLIRQCRHGIRLAERNRNVIIANCQIYDNAETGIFIDNCNLHQMNITGNHISYCKRAGIHQLNGDVHNIQITGNDIEYNAGMEDVLSGEIVLEAADGGMISEYTIASNTIQARPKHSGANVAVVRGEKDGSVGLFAITGNVLGSRNVNLLVRNAHGGMTISGNAIYTGVEGNVVVEQSSNVLLTGNTVRPSSESGPDFGDRGGVRFADCDGCLVSDNIIVTRANGEKPGGSISLIGCRAVSASGNQILRVHHRGVYLEDCKQCRVVGNTIMPQDGCEDFIAVAAEGQNESNVLRDNFPCGTPAANSVQAD